MRSILEREYHDVYPQSESCKSWEILNLVKIFIRESFLCWRAPFPDNAPIGKLHGLLDRWIKLRRSNQLRWLCINQMKHKLKMMSVLSLKTVMVVILKVCFYLIASHIAVPLPLQPKCCLHPRRIRAITQSPHFLLRLSL